MLELNEALEQDALNRNQALDLASFIVEAPAGAGKTELLTQRFLKLLQTVEQPEEIIAITFTNKAAAEMRERIIDSLLLAAKGVPPALPHKQVTYELGQAVIARSKNLGWALLENPARLRLYTIDGLCAALSRQMPLMSRFGAQPNIAEDVEQHYLTAVQQTLGLIDDETYQGVIIEALRYLDNDANKLTQLLVRMLAKRDQWMQYTQQSFEPSAILQAFEQVLDDALQQIAQTLNAPFQSAIRPFAKHAAQHVDIDHRLRLLADWGDDLSADQTDLPKWMALSELMLTGAGALRKTVTKANGFPTSDKETKQEFVSLLTALHGQQDIVTCLQEIRLLPRLAIEDESWEVINVLSQLLNIAAAKLWLVFAQVGEVDFIEVSQRAVSALVEQGDAPTDLALRLDYQIKHLLVDEFQDTSPSQIQLLAQLTKGWQAGDGRTLFLVGDPMQSIYRFRKAEVGLFLNAATEGVGEVPLTALRLYRNNRSCPAVIDWVNAHFDTAFPSQDMAEAGAIHYRPFMPTRAAEAGEGVQIHPIIQPPEWSLEAARLAEAQQVVSLVLATKAQNPDASIAILARARSHLMPIVSVLRKDYAHIRFQAVEVERLSTRQIIQDLLVLTSALLHRGDRVSWLALLRAPWCGLTLHDLHALAGQDDQQTIWRLMLQAESLNLSSDGQSRIAHVVNVINDAFLNQGRQTIGRWVYGVWLQLSGPEALWKQSDGADVEAFFDCVADLESQQQFSLSRLSDEIDKLYAAPDSDGAQLQMMTIHKSKGLEFDTVIVTGMGNQPNLQDDQPIVRWETAVTHHHGEQHAGLLAAPYIPTGKQKNNGVTPYDYLKRLEKQRVAHEDVRVLYVAVTRAVRVLHLVGVVKAGQDGERKVHGASYFGLLWDKLGTEINTHQTEVTNDIEILDDLADFSPALIRLPTLSVPSCLNSYSKTNYRQTAHRSLTEEGIGTTQFKADIGTLTHYYLELMRKAERAWTPEIINALQPAMQHWFAQAAYNPQVAIEGAQAVEALLLTVIGAEDWRWLMQTYEDDATELAMMTMVDGEPKRLVLDRTFKVSVGNEVTRWIIDYKTTSLQHELAGEALQAATKPYHAQLAQYAALFKDEGTVIQKAVFFVSIGRLVRIP